MNGFPKVTNSAFVTDSCLWTCFSQTFTGNIETFKKGRAWPDLNGHLTT
jgi:hypothetical protein